METQRLKRILQEQMPDMELVESTPSAADAGHPRSLDIPSISTLRKKFLAEEADEGYESDTYESGDDEVTAVKVRSKSSGEDGSDAPRATRTVIVSNHGLLGSQG